MKDVVEHVTKTIVSSVIQSLEDSPKDWKVKKEVIHGWDCSSRKITITHKSKPIEIQYWFNSFLNISIWCNKQFMKKTPLGLKIKLKRAAKKVYKDYRAERRVFKLSKVMRGLK